MVEKEFYLVNIGRLLFPCEFNNILCSQNKYIVSRQVDKNYYFEMNGESMYYMLKSEELIYGYDYSFYKEKIVNAICSRMTECHGVLLHRSLVSDELDTQFRATNSAIRILLNAMLDGYNVKNEVESLINYQYKYYLSLRNGIWFPHDLSEYNGECRKRQLKTKAFGKEETNTITLNTHLDSLNTLLLIKSDCFKWNLKIDFDLDLFVNKAIRPLKEIFYQDYKSSIKSNVLQKVDQWFYLGAKNKYRLFNPFSKIYESMLHPILFKVFFPRIFFNYGFIARDLAIRHRHADYMLPNTVDMARFLCMYEYLEDADSIFVADMKKQLAKTITLIEKTEKFDSDYSIAWYQELMILLDALDIPYVRNSLQGEKVYYNPFIITKTKKS